jgi:hypothetical protein
VFKFTGKTGSNTDFVTEILVLDGMTNQYTTKGTLYEGSSLTVTINVEAYELTVLVVKPITGGKPYWFDVEHTGDGSFVMPWYGWFLISIFGCSCLVCFIFAFSFIATALKKAQINA